MLKIDNLSKIYGQQRVLENLTLQIAPGEIYGLLGPNGAGKTTTINIICHLLKADQGKITIADQPISGQTKYLIGIAPQENLFYKSLSCRENLLFFARLYGFSQKQCQQQAQLCLEAVHLLPQADRDVETLSGGMKRRLNTAIALVHKPKLLILDEPTTGLDIETRYEMWELIKQLQGRGMTILLTTHLLDEAEKLCDRIGILKQGSIIAEGSLSELQQVIPAQEIITLKTMQPERAIAIGEKVGLVHRYYGGDLAFWSKESLELPEIMNIFQGITIDAIARQNVRLEHIYLELTNGY